MLVKVKDIKQDQVLYEALEVKDILLDVCGQQNNTVIILPQGERLVLAPHDQYAIQKAAVSVDSLSMQIDQLHIQLSGFIKQISERMRYVEEVVQGLDAAIAGVQSESRTHNVAQDLALEMFILDVECGAALSELGGM